MLVIDPFSLIFGAIFGIALTCIDWRHLDKYFD